MFYLFSLFGWQWKIPYLWSTMKNPLFAFDFSGDVCHIIRCRCHIADLMHCRSHIANLIRCGTHSSDVETVKCVLGSCCNCPGEKFHKNFSKFLLKSAELFFSFCTKKIAFWDSDAFLPVVPRGGMSLLTPRQNVRHPPTNSANGHKRCFLSRHLEWGRRND